MSHFCDLPFGLFFLVLVFGNLGTPSKPDANSDTGLVFVLAILLVLGLESVALK